MRILDISKYQPNVDYAKVAKSVDGVILRIGITYWGAQNMGIDPCFEKHYAGFKAVGCPIGVYYYSAADSVAIARKEAEYCLSLMKGKQFELPIYYDVENNERQGKLSKQDLTYIVDTFCSIIQSAGYFVGYYSYTAWLTGKFDTNYLNSKYTLWKADYRANYDKTIPCDMHQYTSSGVINGINGRVDLSNCFKDFVSIIKSKGLNGFTKNDNYISDKPCRMDIGFASAGDIKVLSALITSLGIKYKVDEGHIITDVEVSKGDQSTIKNECDRLGIPCSIYVEPPKPPIEDACCADCEMLKKENETLRAENETLKDKLLNQESDKALTEQKRLNSELIKELKSLKDKIERIREVLV